MEGTYFGLYVLYAAEIFFIFTGEKRALFQPFAIGPDPQIAVRNLTIFSAYAHVAQDIISFSLLPFRYVEGRRFESHAILFTAIAALYAPCHRSKYAYGGLKLSMI